jgi:hypothetical protein
MSTRSRTRRSRIAVVGGALLLAGILAGSVVAGRMVWLDDATSLDQALADAPAVKIADIAAADGKQARGVFAQVTSTGHFCVSEAPLQAPRGGGGGCNPADDPLGGDVLSATLAYEGGPAIAGVKDARVFGLASADVASVRILMGDGSWRVVELGNADVVSTELQAFGYRFRNFDLKRRVGPTAIVAFDASGAELGRQPTGIGE